MDGKRVFVTGGAKGIGAAIVTAFCNVGARVAFCDTDEKAASRLCDLLPTFVQFFQADASYELAKQGATIVFLENYPTDVPGYGQLEQKRKSYQQTFQHVGRYRCDC